MEKYYKASDIGMLIERLLREPYYQHSGESWYSGVSSVWDAISSLTPKEGKWVTIGEELKNTTCSNCGHWVETPYGKTNYCHNCGAKMTEDS